MERLPVNAMTCDVEDYFQVSAFENIVPRERWTDVECRIPRNVDRILQLFSDFDTKATFFTLGWVAEHHPGVVRRIVEQGHEIASHGMCHHRVWTQSPDEFRADAGDAKKLLEDVAGNAVVGYRAASWSIDARTPWAHRILAELGYRYSSSVYPVSHDTYGMPDAPRHPHVVADSGIIEFPPTTATVLGRNIPIAGGGYFRLFPLALSRHFIDRHERSTDYPYVFYFHPWELDPEQPRMASASLKSRFRHYVNLGKFEDRLTDLLDNYRWGRMDALSLPRGAH
ncbi:MAG: DUF3473 domain-containing protein [Woeseiaceae bacterium]|nr:DUF3473 domain-containing protein [Woeseiaceae bacterium]